MTSNISSSQDRIDKYFEKTKKGREEYIKRFNKILEDYETKKGKGLKTLTPNQLLTRLPILLTQIKAGNNSQALNNEIRQIIYSLYQSKNMSKTVYNHLMNIL